MLYEQRQLSEAKKLLLEALAIYQQVLGAEHPNTLNLLGWLNAVQKDLDKVAESSD